MAEFWGKRGEYSSNDRSNFITLWAFSSTATYSSLRKAGTLVGYQVPAGKKLIITRIVGPNVGNTGTTYALHMLYGDNDIGISSGSSPTNTVRLVGTGSSSSTPFIKHTTNANSKQEWEVFLEVPAGKYPTQQVEVDGCGLYYEGIEVTA